MNDPSPLPNPSSDDTSAPLAPPSSDSLGGETAPASQPAQQQTSENDPAPAPVADTSPVPVATEQPVVEPPSAQVTVEPPSVQAAVEPAKVAPVPPKDVASTPGNMVEVAASGTPPVLVQELSFSPPLSETPPTGEALTPLGSTVLLAPIPMFQNPPKAEVLPPDSESTTDSLWSGEVETLWAAKPEADSNDASAFSWMAFDDLTEKLT